MKSVWSTAFPSESTSGLRRAYIQMVSRSGTAWVVLAVCLIATAVVCINSSHQLRARELLRFDSRVEAFQSIILERMERYVQVLKGAGGLFAASQSVDRGEWQAYFGSMDLSDRFRGLHALGYIEYVPRTNLAAFLESVRRDVALPYNPADFQVWPINNRTDFYAVKFVEPLQRNRTALGFDIGSEQFRRQAADQARDSGQATLTRKIELVQALHQPAVLLLLPIYFNSTNPTNPVQRRASLQGWVYAAFVMQDLMSGIRGFASDELDVNIFDGTDTSEPNQLYGGEISEGRPSRKPRPRFEREITLDFANRTWTLQFQSRPVFEALAGHWVPRVMAAGGFCISLLLFSIARLLSTTRQRGLALAHAMTEKLRLQERAMSSASNGIFILDATLESQPIIYANTAFTKITGYSTEKHLSEETRILLQGTQEPAELRSMRANLKISGTNRTVLREYRKDGTQFWAEYGLSPVRDEEGRITHYVGIVDDVTERKRAELSLQESQERLALVIEGSNDGIWDWNIATSEAYYSPRWKRMLGYDEADIENHLSGWDRLLHPADRDQAYAMIEDYFAGRRSTYELEHRLRHKDGSYRWILARGVALRNSRGKPVRMAGSHVDLTARKEAEEQLRRAYQELSQSDESLKRTLEQLRASHEELKSTQLQLIQAAKLESIGTLAAGVAHEVKNPLQTMLMGLDFIRLSFPDASQDVALALSDMRDAVNRANGIIGELLQLSAATKFSLQEEDFNELVNRSLRLVHSELLAARIEVVQNLQEDLSPVRMDKSKIEQVLINLILNAAQAMSQHGTLTITTRNARFGECLSPNELTARQFEPGEPVVVAEFQDTGEGISEENLSRIFDPFFTTKSVGLGTGLGLSVVKKIIDLHQGHIEIKNSPQGGALVTLILKTK